jgi:hypothetical protein
MNDESKPFEIQENISPLEVSNDEHLTPENQIFLDETVTNQSKVLKTNAEQILEDYLSQIGTNLLTLKQLFEQRLQYDTTKEKAFDALYTKLEHQEK